MTPKVLFIMGTAHCGSTLLTLVLGSHTDCIALGEVSNYPEAYRRQQPVCSICEGHCSFWDDRFSQRDIDLLCKGFAERRLLPFVPLSIDKKLRGWIRQDKAFNPYSIIASRADESVLIDSTKTVYWLEKKLAAREFRSGALEPYLLHLVRDGRAVMHSYSRRKVYQGLDAATYGQQFGEMWHKRITNEQRFFEQFQGKKHFLRYEQFATEPEAITQQLCDWLGIVYQPEMMEYWKFQQHFVSGNTGTQSAMTSSGGKQSQAESTKPKRTGHIQLKQKWRKALTDQHIAAFYKASNNLNQAFEWDSNSLL